MTAPSPRPFHFPDDGHDHRRRAALCRGERARGFGATIDNTRGSALEWRAGLDSYPWKNVGFVATYDDVDIEVTMEKDPTLEPEYEYGGPMVHLVAGLPGGSNTS